MATCSPKLGEMIRPKSHVDGDSAELLFQHVMNASGRWLLNSLSSDYGFDFVGQVVSDGHVSSAYALFQVKTRHDDTAVRVPRRHVEFWRRLSVPSFVAAVDLRNNEIRVASCHALAALAKESAQSVTLRRAAFARLTPVSQHLLCMGVAQYWDDLHVHAHVAMQRLVATMFAPGAVAGYMLSPIGGIASFLGEIVGSLMAKSPSARPDPVPSDVELFKVWVEQQQKLFSESIS